jgi:uncharacterized membrane protein
VGGGRGGAYFLFLGLALFCEEKKSSKGGRRTSARAAAAMVSVEKVASVALAGLSLAPLVIKVSSNFNVIATACLTVFIGCHRSVKPAPPSETVSKEHAMRFPFIGSAVLLSLFLLFKFLPKDLINTVLTLYFFVLGILALSCVLFTFDSVVFRGFLNFGSCKINI